VDGVRAFLLVAALFAARPALAQKTETTGESKTLADALSGIAKADYLAGRALFNDGDFATALVKFRSAFDASKDGRLLWNMGACERGLRHYAEASRYLEQFKQASLVTDRDRAEADDILKALRPYVAAVKVQVNVDEAVVLVDQRPMGRSPLEPFLVDLGAHRLEVKKDGFVDAVELLDIVDPAERTVDVRLSEKHHQGRVSIVAGPGESILIDGAVVGSARYEGALASGSHVVRILGEGKKPYEARIIVNDDQTRTIEVTLERRPLLPVWAWIGLGAVAATGLGTVGYFAFRSDGAKPEPVVGTLPPQLVQLSR